MEWLWWMMCGVLIILAFGNPIEMVQTGSIVVLGEMFRSTKHWELNRKRKVPDFEPRQKRKKKNKKVKKEVLVPEGANEENLISPRVSTVKEYFDLFRNKWKDKIDWVTIELVDFVMEYFDLWKNKWKAKVSFPKKMTISKVYFASEYLRQNYGGLKDYSSAAPTEVPRLESVFKAEKSDNSFRHWGFNVANSIESGLRW
jgi:hypothetical protein